MQQIDYANIFFKMYGSPKEYKKDFLEEFVKWEYFPIYKEGSIAALIATKGSEIHCGCFPEYRGRWFPKQRVQRIFKEILLKYGKITTSTFKEYSSFVERLGFKEINRMKDIIYYIKTEV